MKILMTAPDADPGTQIEPRFGRATGFVIYDSNDDSYQFVANEQNLQAAQGAGIQAAQQAVALGADWVITGHCGPKAFQVLKAARVHIALNVNESLAEAVAKTMAGELTDAETADVEGHWV